MYKDINFLDALRKKTNEGKHGKSDIFKENINIKIDKK